MPSAVAVNVAGAGRLSVHLIREIAVDVSGAGDLDIELDYVVVAAMTLDILDPSITETPSSVTVMAFDGWPDMPVEFAVDGEVVLTETLDSQGAYGPVSLPVSDAHGAVGSHVVTVTGTGTQASEQGSGTFAVTRGPRLYPHLFAEDADPIDIPASHTATGVRRWVLQDLTPGGLGSWVMLRNPTSMAPPPSRRTLSQEHTTAPSGKFHITEAPPIEAHSWEFAGFISTKAEHDILLAYAALRRRIYVIDHRGRAWTVVIVSVDLAPRKRFVDAGGSFNDWGHDYTVNALVHGTEWKTPV